MATQKKSGAGRKTSTAGKRKTKASSSSRSKKSTAGKGRSSAPAQKPFRREAGAVMDDVAFKVAETTAAIVGKQMEQ